MDIQPFLESELVRLRPLTTQDRDNLFSVARDPKIWEQHPSKRYLWPEFEKYFSESIASGGALAILDKVTGNILGSTRFKLIPGLPDAVEIGWTFLGRGYWGGKYNREVKTLMTGHAFASVSRIIFLVNKDNIRSQKAIEKIKGRRITSDDPVLSGITGGNAIIYLLEKSSR